MQTTRNIPLFRTAPLAVLAEPSAAATTPPTAASIGDLTDYVGATVDAATWAALQAECAQRYGDTWTMYAEPHRGGYHIASLHARPAC